MASSAHNRGTNVAVANVTGADNGGTVADVTNANMAGTDNRSAKMADNGTVGNARSSASDHTRSRSRSGLGRGLVASESL